MYALSTAQRALVRVCSLLTKKLAFQVVNNSYKIEHLPRILLELGMHAYDTTFHDGVAHLYPVMLEGRMVGWIERELARDFLESLRVMKVKGLQGVGHSCCTQLVYEAC